MPRLVIILLLSTIVGCQKGNQGAKGLLYVVNSGPNGNDASILRFRGATEVGGDTAPDATITGASTTLVCPYFGHLDTTNDRLYIADPCSSAVNVFDNASTITGNAAPDRRITGALTQFAPAGATSMMAVTVDASKDILYVSTSEITGAIAKVAVFDDAATVNGNVAPDRVITTPATAGSMLKFNHGIYLDAKNDRIFVASSGDGSILIWDDASTKDGSTAPTRWVSGSNTFLTAATFPVGVRLDANRNLMVSCRTADAVPTAGGILIFSVLNLLGTGNLNLTPSRTPITGNVSTLVGPYMMEYKSNSPQLFVANAFGGGVAVFEDFNSVDDDVAPARTVSGTQTGLSTTPGARTATGIMLDMTR